MSMSVGEGGTDADPMMDINMTPLIDVLLVLLVMFIITIPVMTHAVKLDMPRAQNTPQQNVQPVVINLEIDFDGTVLWNGETLPDAQALDAKLREAAAQTDQPEVHLRPNKLVAYKSVAAVMAAAQRLGVTKLGIVGNEQFIK